MTGVVRIKTLGARLAIGSLVVGALAGCGSAKSMEGTAHLCGVTFFNFQPLHLPAPRSAAQERPPAGNELPPPSAGSKAYRLVLQFGDCTHGSIVVADPVNGIVVNRLVLAHDGTVTALGITPLRETVLRAWKAGRLVGAGIVTPGGALLPTG